MKNEVNEVNYNEKAAAYFQSRGKHHIYYQGLKGHVESKDMIYFYKTDNPKLNVNVVCMPLQTYMWINKGII